MSLPLFATIPSRMEHPRYVNASGPTSTGNMATASGSLGPGIEGIESLIGSLLLSSVSASTVNGTIFKTSVLGPTIPPPLTAGVAPATAMSPAALSSVGGITTAYTSTAASSTTATPILKATPATTKSEAHKSGSLTSAQLAGTIAGSIAGGSLLIAIILYLWQRRWRQRSATRHGPTSKTLGSSEDMKRVDSTKTYQGRLHGLAFSPPPPALPLSRLGTGNAIRDVGRGQVTKPGGRIGVAATAAAPLTPTRSMQQEQYPDQGNPFADELGLEGVAAMAAAWGKQEVEEAEGAAVVSPLLSRDVGWAVVAPIPLDTRGSVRVWEHMGLHGVERKGSVRLPRPRSGVAELDGSGGDGII